MGTLLGAPFEQVRVHTDENAARMSRDLRAQAFAHGSDIYFKRGAYDPASREGRRLLAHELVHVVQQGAAGPTVRRRPDEAPDSVSLVEVSCLTNQVTFHTKSGDVSYALNACNIVDGEFDFKVTVDKKKGSLSLDIDSTLIPVDAFRFGFDIAPGQPNPISFFGAQKKVKVRGETKTTIDAASNLDEFKARVREAGKLRMDGNKAHLEAWKAFFTEKLTPRQVEGQAMATRANQLGTIAAEEGGRTLSTFDEWSHTDNPYLAWVKEQQIQGRYRACTGCHATVQAENMWRERGSDVQAPPTAARALTEHARTESVNTPPRPDLGQASSGPALEKFAGYESATQVMQAVETLRPYLAELGPARYDVLPLDIFTSPRTPAELLSTIVQNIQNRQAGYDAFKAKIEDPGFDYLMLRPIVSDLLPFATPEVRGEVQDEISKAQSWEMVKVIAIGAATVGLLVLSVFPPTSAVGMAGVVALESSLAAYGVHSGAEMYQQGALLSKGLGADDVLDPQQQKAADTMMAMGLVTLGLSAVSLGVSGFKTITLIRGAKDGTRALGAVTSIEGQLENGSTVKLTELAGGSPKLVVLGKDGELLADGTLPDSVLTGKPVKVDELPSQGVRGAMPRTGTPDRPVSFQGRAPTCGSVSCEMVASMGGSVDREVLKKMLNEAGVKGVTTDQMVTMLKWNKVASEAKVGWKVADLEAATDGGNPAIAVIKTNNPAQPLHAVVIDGVSVRNGVRVVAIRNPWGVQYFQSEGEFAKSFTGLAVKVLHWF